jgi:hypothetical protein
MSTTKPKPIRAVLGFTRLADTDLVSRATAVLTGLMGNLKFPTPPVDLNVLKSSIESLAAAIAEALDGSKKAIATKNNERNALVNILRQLATYVESNCNEDMAIFTSSGFEARSTVRTPSQSLTQPVIKKIDQGSNSGQLLVKIAAIPNARSYEFRHAAIANGNPGPWTTLTLTGVKAPVSVTGLTPGTIYGFQVRALGKPGFTDWSDSVTRMVI